VRRFAYSFGPVTFIHYSTEHHFHKGSKQHSFVKAALAAVDRSVTPWVIFAGVCFLHSMFSLLFGIYPPDLNAAV
jgi:hypothetical protein